MTKEELCKRCVKKGIVPARAVLPGEKVCQYCRFVNKRCEEGRLKIEKWNYASFGNETGFVGGYGPAGRGNYADRDSNTGRYIKKNDVRGQRGNDHDNDIGDYDNEIVKEIMSARLPHRAADSNDTSHLDHAKDSIWSNSITLKFSGNSMATQAKKAKKYTKHDRFRKLASGFPVKKIKSHAHYRAAVKRALSVETESRAANFAYLKLLDLELAKYEKVHPDDCKRMWIEICNEWEKRADKNKKV